MRLVPSISVKVLFPGVALFLVASGAFVYANGGWMAVGAVAFVVSVLFMWAGYRSARSVHSLAHGFQEEDAEDQTELLATSRITELRALGVAWSDTRNRMDRMLAAQQDFTANAAHELRTPLAALRLAGESALRSIPDQEVAARDAIGAMLEESGRASHLIDRLLMLARTESGHIPVEARQTALREVVEPLLEWLRPLAEERGQTLMLDVEQPVSARVDENMLRMALENLVGNAIRYGPADSAVIVRLGQLKEDVVALDVLDEGPGIDPDEVDHLFERFKRGHRARMGGSGLGLSIARWAVEAFDGRIEYERRIGQGSLFRICCPATEPNREGDDEPGRE